MRGKTRQKDGTVPLAAEVLAGGCVRLKSAVTFVTFRDENLVTRLQVKGITTVNLKVLHSGAFFHPNNPNKSHVPYHIIHNNW